MADKDSGCTRRLNLTRHEIAEMARGLPPVLLLEQASEIFGIPLGTLYEWSSRGRLASCARRRGKRLHLATARFIEELFNGEEW